MNALSAEHDHQRRRSPPWRYALMEVIVVRKHVRLFVHLVWSTHQRQPALDDELRPEVHAAIAAACTKAGCVTVEVGGFDDHVHLLAELARTVSVSELARFVKGSSSHLVNHELRPGIGFRWQRDYAAFSVDHRDVMALRRYILNQAERHAAGQHRAEYEPPLTPSLPAGLASHPSVPQAFSLGSKGPRGIVARPTLRSRTP